MSKFSRAISTLVRGPRLAESASAEPITLEHGVPARDVAAAVESEKQFYSVENVNFPVVYESFTGAWQQRAVTHRETLLASHAVFACVTLIAQDIGKMCPQLLAQMKSGIWKEISSPSFSPVLRRPNHYQNSIQFIETWINSKLYRGNTYILKERDGRGVIVATYPLHPDRVTVLVADGGDVFYQLNTDNLSGIGESIIVPATEIIHDRMNCLFHPLIGISPLYAAGLAAFQALNIQKNSAAFFENMSRPSGTLTSDQRIGDDTAKRLSTDWQTNYGKHNAGKVAVLGEGLKYDAISVSAVDAQLIEQLKWTAEVVCSVYHVPAFMVGMGTLPPYNNIEALNQQYYSQCLQSLIQHAEAGYTEGLELFDTANPYKVRLDTKALLRMDTASRYKAHSESITGGWRKPDEARADEDLEPVPGGNTPYMQQQNYSLAALAARDAAGPAPAALAPGSQHQLPSPKLAVDPSEEDQIDAAKEFRRQVEVLTS